ncbi:MAG: hypothetical protein AAF399_13480 [Bacteroidota bacterium]
MKTLWMVLMAGVMISSCKLADLSTAQAHEDQSSRGKAILEGAMRAHGADKWDQIASYEGEMEDEFYGVMGNVANPHKANPVSVKLTLEPRTYGGMLHFQDQEAKDKAWGLEDGAGYSLNWAGERSNKRAKDALFWIPTYQYFVEFPARILEADVFRYTGTEDIKGRTCDRVFVSWNQVDPQKEFDQYLVWVDQESHLIQKVEYTVREAGGFLTGFIMLEEMKDFDGILLPTRMPVGSSLLKEGKWLHEMRIKGLVFTRTSLGKG